MRTRAHDHAHDLFLRLAAIKPEHVDDIAFLLVHSFETAIHEERRACENIAETAANKHEAERLELYGKRGEGNAAAASNAADEIAEAIRARTLPAADGAKS